MGEPYSWFALIVFALAIINVSRSFSVIIIIILVAKIKVTLSHKNVAGHCTQVVVTSRALVKCQLYSSSSSSSTVRPMFSLLDKTHWTAATSDCVGMSDMTT